MAQQKNIFVYAHWREFNEPVLMGNLKVMPSRGKEVFAFEYTQNWLKKGFSQILDPNLQLYSGPQYLPEEKNNFGIFLDSSPDRWGKLLMRRREAAFARKEGRKENTLLESDFLLGVFDNHRMGALRFKENDETEPFLNDNEKMSAPPWTSLRKLEDASLKFEEDNIDDPDYLKWVNILIAPGSSLGGARPKASVIDPGGNLWIAKFPSLKDEKNVGAWEVVVNELAIKAGLDVAEGRIQQFNNKYHTYLTKRFDRTSKGERIHFASAMTMLGYTDGKASHEEGVSYLELVEFLTRFGANINNDLKELWRRIVFNVCVKNTDDHLRNHGFLLTDTGWRLSPAYDLNSIEHGTGLNLNISETDNSLDLDLVLSVAKHFRLKNNHANQIITEVKDAVSYWRETAKKYSLSKQEQDLMANAFII